MQHGRLCICTLSSLRNYLKIFRNHINESLLAVILLSYNMILFTGTSKAI